MADTACWIAAVRARETERHDWLFADPYARDEGGFFGLRESDCVSRLTANMSAGRLTTAARPRTLTVAGHLQITTAGRYTVTGRLDLALQRRTAIPLATYVAALENWQLAGHVGELRLGRSLLRGPIELDPHSGVWRIEVGLARRVRPPLRMRLEIASWYSGATILELIPLGRVRPSATYFAAGHGLLDLLTASVRAHVPAPRRTGQDHLGASVGAGSLAGSRA